MSKNDIVVIYKFKNVKGQYVYLVMYACADTYAEYTAEEFRALVASHRYTTKYSVALRKAQQLQDKYMPEYGYVICHEYLDAFTANITQFEYVDDYSDTESDDEIHCDYENSTVDETAALHTEVESLKAQLQHTTDELGKTAEELRRTKAQLLDEKGNLAKKSHEMAIVVRLSEQVGRALEATQERLEEYRQTIRYREEEIVVLKRLGNGVRFF